MFTLRMSQFQTSLLKVLENLLDELLFVVDRSDYVAYVCTTFMFAPVSLDGIISEGMIVMITSPPPLTATLVVS